MLKASGICFAGVGVLLVALAWSMDTSVSSFAAGFDEVSNLSLMQEQMIRLNVGLGLFVSGVMLLGFGAVIEALHSGAAPATTLEKRVVEQPVSAEHREAAENYNDARRVVAFALGCAFVVFVVVVAVQ